MEVYYPLYTEAKSCITKIFHSRINYLYVPDYLYACMCVSVLDAMDGKEKRTLKVYIATVIVLKAMKQLEPTTGNGIDTLTP